MATFTKTPNPMDDPNYLGLSRPYDGRGYDTSVGRAYDISVDRPSRDSGSVDRLSGPSIGSLPSPPIPSITRPSYSEDKTGGLIAKGFGDLFGLGVDVTDTVTKDAAKTQLHSELNKVRDSFGVADALRTAQSGETLVPVEGNVPVSVNKLGNRVEGLTEAFKAGKLSESRYWVEMELAVRGVKEKFPGYTDYIDTEVRKIAGTTPANALRSSIHKDLVDLNNKMAGQQDRFMRDVVSKWEYLSPETQKAVFSGQPIDKNAVYLEMAEREYKDKELQRDNARLDNMAKERTLTSVQAEDSFVRQGNQIVNRTIADMLPPRVQKLLDEAAANPTKQYTPQEREQITTALNTLKFQVNQRMSALAVAPFTPGSTNSFNSVIDPVKISQLVERVSAPLKNLESAIMDQNIGLVSRSGRMAKAAEEKAVADFMLQDETAAKAAAIRQTFGTEGWRTLMLDPKSQIMKKMIPSIQKYMDGKSEIHRESSVVNTLNGTGRTMTQEVQTAKQLSTSNPATYTALVSDRAEIIRNPAVPRNIRAKAVQELFEVAKTTDFIKQFKAGDWTNLYTMMASPGMKDIVKDIAKEHPEAWEAYSSWVKDNFVGTFKNELDTFAAFANERGRDFQLSYRPDANMVYIERRPGMTRGRDVDLPNAENSSRYLVRLNQIIKIVEPVLKEEGKDIGPAILGLLQEAGVSPSFKPSKSNSEDVNQFMRQMYKSIFSGMSEEEKAKNMKYLRPTSNLGEIISGPFPAAR